MGDVTASARVQLTVDVPIAAVYGKGWTFEQIQQDAAASAIGRLKKVLRDTDAQVIGEPVVTVVWAKEVR